MVFRAKVATKERNMEVLIYGAGQKGAGRESRIGNVDHSKGSKP